MYKDRGSRHTDRGIFSLKIIGIRDILGKRYWNGRSRKEIPSLPRHRGSKWYFFSQCRTPILD